MDKMCLHGFVKGRVQGVWFRRFAQKKASSLNLTGWVKNTKEGYVEVLICGNKSEVVAMEKWLWIGSPLAKVESVELKEIPFETHATFEIID